MQEGNCLVCKFGHDDLHVIILGYCLSLTSYYAYLKLSYKSIIKPSKSSTSNNLLRHSLVALGFLILNKIHFHYSPLTIEYYFWIHSL